MEKLDTASAKQLLEKEGYHVLPPWYFPDPVKLYDCTEEHKTVFYRFAMENNATVETIRFCFNYTAKILGYKIIEDWTKWNSR